MYGWSSGTEVWLAERRSYEMTQIQVDYWRNVETKRHNVATEGQAVNELKEAKRHNTVGEKETRRHNVAGEKETKRHNIATESTEKGKLTETRRHNKAGESIDRYKAKETKRHNKASEGIDRSKTSETRRHNQVTEAQERRKIDISQQSIDAQVSKWTSEAALNQYELSWRNDNPELYNLQRLGIKPGKYVGSTVTLAALGFNTLAQAVKNGLVDSSGNLTAKGSQAATKKVKISQDAYNLDRVRSEAQAYASRQKGWTSQQQEVYVNRAVKEAKKKLK
nr:putative ORF1 [Marmot picobirnavirus]